MNQRLTYLNNGIRHQVSLIEAVSQELTAQAVPESHTRRYGA